MLKKSAKNIITITMVIVLSLTVTPVYVIDAKDNNNEVEQYIETSYKTSFSPSYSGDAAWLNDFELEEDPATAGKVILEKYVGTAEELYIPDKVTIGTTEYNVTLSSNISYFLNTGTEDQNTATKSIIFDSDIDTSNVTNMSNMFYNCTSLETVNMSGFDTSNVTDITFMFNKCSSLSNLDLHNFDLGSLSDQYDYSETFSGCTSLNTINTPLNLNRDIALPTTFYRKGAPSETYDNLPKNITTSFTIVNSSYVAPTSISVSPTSKTISVGDSFIITPTILPDNASDKRIIWSSSNPAVASVDTIGKVTGLASGVATITATTSDGGMTATCEVTVSSSTIDVTGITLTPASKAINVGGTFTITPNVLPNNATDKSVTWSSRDTTVATVDDTGKVTGISNGTTTITATTGDGGYKATCTVTVDEYSSSVDVYRLYNPNSGEHFYTGNNNERHYLATIGWKDEGYAWTSPAQTDKPVYRLYNPNSGEHHYTTNISEKNYLLSLGWNDEDISWYSIRTQTSGTAIYRLYNPYAHGSGAHHYTSDVSERNHLVSLGWNYEGIGWYGL